MAEPIFHLADPGDWARSIDAYAPESVETEGFVHCSVADQLSRVAHDFYIWRNDLVLLTIDPHRLRSGTLVFEDLYDLGDEFPHVYGPLPTSAVVSTGPYLTHLEEGLWLDTRFDPQWMDRMLHPEFTEVAISGRTYTRAESTAATDLEVSLPHEDYSLELIDEDVALVRYVSHDAVDGVERHAHRTSIWINTNEGWRLRFHQGTPLP